MSLESIIYLSTACAPLNAAQLDALLAQARARNRIEQVSGCLLYDHGSFMQYLEGPSDRLGAVWRSIERDSRHRDIVLLQHAPCAERAFAGWLMARVPGDESLWRQLRQFTAHDGAAAQRAPAATALLRQFLASARVHAEQPAVIPAVIAAVRPAGQAGD